MITIDGFELENTKEFTVTENYVKQRLHEFNEKYFNNELDVDCFPIKLFPYKNAGGSIYFDCCYSRRTGQIYNAKIKNFRISTNFSFTELQLCNIILHEMIHVYQVQILKRQDLRGTSLEPHGQTFTTKMDEINKKGWNIKIKMFLGDGYSGLSQKGVERARAGYVDINKESVVQVVYRGCITTKKDYEKLGKVVDIVITYKNWLLQKDRINYYLSKIYNYQYFVVYNITKNFSIEKKELYDLDHPKKRYNIFSTFKSVIDYNITNGYIVNMDEYKEMDLDESIDKEDNFIKALQKDSYTEIDVREDGDIVSISGIIS